MPTQAIDFVLKTAGISPGRVDWAAINGYHAAFPMTREQLLEEYERNNDWDKTAQRKLKRMIRAGAKSLGMLERIRSRRQDDRVKELLALGFPRERIVFVEHHTAHASAAYYGLANFYDDILVLTADGSGDGVCASVSIGRKGRLERLHQIPMAHSLGNIYAMVTFLMGMVPLEHEYKVMGLAPYADPKGAERVFQKRRFWQFWQKAGGC